MKKILLTIIILLSINSQGQTKKLKYYSFEAENIEYSRIDYSKHGIAQIFVSMCEDKPTTILIEKNAIDCLNKESNIYHTLYFFIKIPAKYDLENRKKIFSGVINQIESEEKLKNFDLYLNFDVNYSDIYQTKVIEAGLKNKIIRILSDIDSNTICRGLDIVRN